jgi:hypothetical protein
MTMKTNEELERAAYIAGDTRTAELLAQVADFEPIEEAAQDISEVPSIIEAVQDLGGIEEIRARLEELETHKEFFNDCFACLAGHYPCPSVTSDYDKSVIFAAIEKAENTAD